MGSGLKGGPRLVETDVPVGADAENLHVDPARVRDRTLVARALFRRIARGTVQEMNPLGREVHAVEEVRVHEGAKAAGVVGRDPHELIEVEGRRAREVGALLLHARHQLVIEEHRRPARRQAQHEAGRVRERGGNAVGQRAGGGALIREDREARRTGRSHHSERYFGIRAPPVAS